MCVMWTSEGDRQAAQLKANPGPPRASPPGQQQLVQSHHQTQQLLQGQLQLQLHQQQLQQLQQYEQQDQQPRPASAAHAPAGDITPPGAAESTEEATAVYPRLRGASSGSFTTVFHASPTSLLDLTQVKRVVDCAYYADVYQGKLLVRLNDAGDPASLSAHFDAAILQDLQSLGVTPDAVSRCSDYFVKCEQMAERLIMLGRAYVDVSCDKPLMTSADVFDASDTGLSCKDRPPEESLHLFRLLCADPIIYTSGRSQYHYRTGTNFAAYPSCAFAAPIVYVLEGAYPTCAFAAPIVVTLEGAYPTCAFAAPIVDMLEGVTHALLGPDDDEEFYTWVQRSLGTHSSVSTCKFGRIELFEGSAAVTARARALMDSPAAIGLDDPRLPTLRGLLRGGMSALPLREALLSLGASRRTLAVKLDALWAANRRFLEPLAPRYMAVRCKGCVRMSVAHRPRGADALAVAVHPRHAALGTRTLHTADRVLLDAQLSVVLSDALAVAVHPRNAALGTRTLHTADRVLLDAQRSARARCTPPTASFLMLRHACVVVLAERCDAVHPHNAALGTRTLHTTGRVLLNAQDAEHIEEGEEVTLLRWTSVLVIGARRAAASGRGACALESEYLPVFKFLKKKRAVTWLAERPDLVPLRLVQFPPLLPHRGRGGGGGAAWQPPQVTDAVGDPALAGLKAGALIQLERLGFFRVDSPYVSPRQPMVLFKVPDGKSRSRHSALSVHTPRSQAPRTPHF
ncbi:tRNA synthetases class I, catalytic domain-containing protein [Tribonema minus]|uniref:tRNA synthetases class I, catalytic domain-containing protein n=1 Tax=Tribonema minus TaxID=303371 RepID=A0A835YK55_9STRA|nr:tRNA synthetases class I, catalytic domain-containing protein [Tribonema minus]